MSEQKNELKQTIEKASKTIFKIKGTHGIETAFALSDDIILAAAHSLHEEGETTITRLDGTELKTEFIGKDPRLDVAVFRSLEEKLQSITTASETSVGEKVITIGANRQGEGPRITTGLISALGDEWLTGSGARVLKKIDVEAELPWGSSGGLLMNMKGESFGMNTHSLVIGGTTIPIQTLEDTVKKILKSGSVSSGWLGVKVHQVELEDNIAEVEGQETGVLIVWRSWRGVAKSAGIKVGDILISADGEKLTDHKSFRSLFSAAGGKTVELKLIRSGKEKTLNVEVKEKKVRKRRRKIAACC